MKHFLKLVLVLLALVGSTNATSAGADKFPSGPIRIIVPFPPGGGTDTVARLVSARLSERWKVPVNVENRPGGNTLIGADAAARAAPDGHTLFVPIDSTLAMNQWLYNRLPYDPVKSFAPVTLAATMPMVLAVNPAVKATTVKELIALSKAEPTAYAHGALPAQIAGEVFKVSAKVDMVSVAYKGSSQAMIDTVGGSVPVIFDALGPALAFVKSGKVRALAVTGAARSPLLPDVPTFAEAGVPGEELLTWIGFAVPANVDRTIIAKLNTEIVDILKMPETREQLSKLGMQVVASTPEQFARTIQSDAAKFERIIKAAGIKLD
jgi:tripartite-type tricarboxylate transporter receptor subunit TctC